MLNRMLVLILVLIFAFTALSCGGGSPASPSPSPSGSVPSGQQQELTTLPADTAQLPALESMPIPARQSNLMGPAYYEVYFDEILMQSNASLVGGNLELDGSSGPAYALWGVQGFDGDNGPTSAQVTMTDVTGSYFVTYSDYEAGHWSHTGPFNAGATSEMPGLGNYFSPTAYTSDNGTCYFGVVVPEGSTATISRIKLGVHGGNLGPTKAWILMGMGGPDGVQLFWPHSVDYRAPDFAGYLLEKAPAYYGDFEPLVFAPIMTDQYYDASTEPGQSYRYRVCAVDTEGNRSTWATSTVSVNPANPTGCNVVLDMPRGPLYGPVEVEFDMSGSSNPTGDPIDQYIIDFGPTMPVYMGASPQHTRILQPGLYAIRAQVTSGGATGMSMQMLKVYPQWEDTPVNVANSDTDFPRCGYPRAIRHPGTGLLTMIMFDMTMPSLVIWQERPGGGFELIPVQTLGNPFSITEPVIMGDEILFATVLNTSFPQVNLYSFDGETPTLTSVSGIVEDSSIALTTDGESQFWIFHTIESGGNVNLVVKSSVNPASYSTLLIGIGNISSIDAAYCPDSQMIHVVCGESASTETNWHKYELASNSIIMNHTLAGAASGCVDLELNPATGTPAVAYYITDEVHYRQLAEASGDFGTDYQPDTSVDNNSFVDLCFKGETPFCYFSTDAGTAGLYEYAASDDWPRRNDSGLAANSASPASLADMSGTGNLYAVDRDTGGNMHLLGLVNDGTTVEQLFLPTGKILGWMMHADAGGDGIHVISGNLFSTNHFTSPTGDVWTERPLMGGYLYADICATTNGDMFVSYTDLGGNAKLDWWNAATETWDNELTNVGSKSFISSSCADNYVSYGYYTSGDTTLHVHTGMHGAPFTHYTHPDIDEYPHYALISQFDGSVYGLAGLPTINDSHPGQYDFDDNEFQEFQLNGPILFMHDQGVLQRQITDGLVCSRYVPFNREKVLYLSDNGMRQPLRLEFKQVGEMEATVLPLAADPRIQEARRTVSSDLTWGGGVVAIVANVDGTQTYMEWGNRGIWEELPVPELETASMHEVVVGMDGRWHIIYYDYFNNMLKCISTTSVVP